ncbi:hypothetical protein C6501_16445 [Candidatus Poribacteria bacterium]|nr:MAG: hypothetical protein C6501_16445 [Candidatus Poribacteria bacterium]
MEKVFTAETQKQGFEETYTFHIQKNGEGWVGWIQELPEVNAEQGTREELLKTLAIEFGKVLKMYETQAETWDKQFEDDVKAGKLDRFAEEALADFQAGKCEEI